MSEIKEIENQDQDQAIEELQSAEDIIYQIDETLKLISVLLDVFLSALKENKIIDIIKNINIGDIRHVDMSDLLVLYKSIDFSELKNNGVKYKTIIEQLTKLYGKQKHLNSDIKHYWEESQEMADVFIGENKDVPFITTETEKQLALLIIGAFNWKKNIFPMLNYQSIYIEKIKQQLTNL